MSERLIEAAARVNSGSSVTPLPAVILRPGAVSGHSVTGANAPNDYVNRVLRGVCSLRAVCKDVTTVYIDLVPVDWVAASCVAVLHSLVTEPTTLQPAQV